MAAGRASIRGPGPCVNPRNPHSATPGVAGAVRRARGMGDETAARRRRAGSRRSRWAPRSPAAAVRMPRGQGIRAARRAPTRSLPPVDWVDPPEGGRQRLYETYVSAVDDDGNEVAGIRLPPIAVPLGTYTGWNVYRAQPGELADRDGSLIPFARTAPSARRPTTCGPRSKSATAAARPMSPRSRPPRSARRRAAAAAGRRAAFVAAAKECDRF